MGDGLTERDAKAIGDAIGILRAAGYDVEKIGEGTGTDTGVQFDLHIKAPTRYDRFSHQVEAMKEVALETPKIDMYGNQWAPDDE